MSRRLLGVLCTLLLVSTLALSWYSLRLRSQLGRAERYVQSGADSIFFICSPVLRELKERPAGGIEDGVIRIARECVGQVSDADAQPTADAFTSKNIPAITSRIKAKLDDREFPYSTSNAVEDRYLPKSYKN